jgi:hypothetical protein
MSRRLGPLLGLSDIVCRTRNPTLLSIIVATRSQLTIDNREQGSRISHLRW